MKWFCKQEVLAYCQECGLAYKKEHHGDFTEYCSIHRAPRVARRQRINAVIGWASTNWERIEKQMIDEQAEQHKKYDEVMSRMQQAQMNSQYGQSNQRSMYDAQQMNLNRTNGLGL